MGVTRDSILILEVPAVYLRAGSGKRPGICVGARKADHLMTLANQFLDNSRPNESRRTGDKNAHKNFFNLLRSLIETG
jgi:hypothetical protein